MTIPGSETSRSLHEVSGEIEGHRRSAAATAVGGIGLSTTTVSAVVWAPWWIAAMLIFATVLCALVARVFPQESADRLE
jgi:hypothetical protein